MKVVSPVVLTDALLISSSLPENDAPAWAAGTTYAKGARVIVASAHHLYESLAASNVGADPRTSPEKWLDLGPTNRWRMFDQAVGTMSAGTGTIDVTMAPGGISALAAIDTTATTVRVIVTVNSTVLYDQTRSTNVSGGVIDNWYTYFTADVGRVTALIFDELPSFSNAQVRVILTGEDPGGPVGIGTLLTGKSIDLGLTEAGASAGITDFSRKVTDEFGVTTIVERAWSKKATVRTLIDTAAVDGVQRRLAALRARPALWIGEDGFDCLTIYGFFKDFSLDLALPETSYCSLTIEGLI